MARSSIVMEVLWQNLIWLGMTFLVTGVWCEAPEVFVEVGAEAVLPCVIQHHSPIAVTISWSNDKGSTVWRRQKSGLEYRAVNSPQRVRCPHPEVGTGNYSLHIEEVTERDAGEYKCVLVDRAGLARARKVLLRVIRVSVSPPAQVVGKTVTINCHVTPWPMGATVSWSLNGRPFQNQDLLYEVWKTSDGLVSGRSLKGKLTQSVMGDWTCVVRHGVVRGNEGKATQALTWRGIVSPSSDGTRVYAAVGSAVTLPCVFSSDLAPSDLRWERRPASAPPVPPSFNLSSVGPRAPWDGSLGVSQVGQGDGGGYRCSGTVEGTRVVRDVQLVTAQVLSSAASARGPAVTLTCHLSDASEVTDYEWVQLTYDLNGTKSVIPVQKGKVLKVAVATEKTSDWACQFYGKQGILGNVTYQVYAMSGVTGGRDTGASSSDVATVAGLSFLLLLLLIIVVQMLKNYQRRRRMLLYPALETIAHSQAKEREDRERKRVKDDEI